MPLPNAAEPLRQEGWQEGWQEGRQEADQQIAIRLLEGGIPAHQVAQFTKLSIEMVRALNKKKMHS